MTSGWTADETDERRLVARIATGDRAAFEDFYRAYARRVSAFVRDVVGSPELTEEVTSDAMVAVWSSAARYRGESRVLTWVLSIAHHKALDALRRRGVGQIAFETLPEFERERGASSDELSRFVDRLGLELALRALSAEHRTVLQLMYGFGCSQTEIATIVGCPVATVKTRAFYAKRRLREQLERNAAAEELA